jgi:calcineurin-like phosphoesterase family protein
MPARTITTLSIAIAAVSGPSLAEGGADVAEPAPVVVAAGDIACPSRPCQAHIDTGNVVRSLHPDAVLSLGDHQYDTGALADFQSSYDPTWGSFRWKTFPSPGNHEYLTQDAAGYFTYFGFRAHGPKGFYSVDIGEWRVYSLNSEAWHNQQRRWLRRDLATDDHLCEIAYWHRPRWSSSSIHGSNPEVGDWWRVLYRAGVDVALAGHSHNYERFGLQDPLGNYTPDGVREFVVGTGGRSLYSFSTPLPRSQRRLVTYGVLELTLEPTRYAWRFVTRTGDVADSGSFGCHG